MMLMKGILSILRRNTWAVHMRMTYFHALTALTLTEPTCSHTSMCIYMYTVIPGRQTRTPQELLRHAVLVAQAALFPECTVARCWFDVDVRCSVEQESVLTAGRTSPHHTCVLVGETKVRRPS